MTVALLFLAAATLGLAQTEQHYDVVVRNGRVMDPETNRDEVAESRATFPSSRNRGRS